jgi:hypothetical protein
MLLGGVSMVSIRAACAGNVVSAAPVSCGPQFMLYVSLPLSPGGSSSRPVYGLRIGEFRKRPTTTQLVAVAPVQRELIDLQIVGHSDVRIEFGRRLVWSVTRGAVGRQSTVFAIGVPIKGIRLSDGVNQQPWDPGTAGMSALAGNPNRTWQVDGERLAIVNVVIPLHWTATDSRPVYMQLRPTIKFVNTPPTEAVLPLRSAETH